MKNYMVDIETLGLDPYHSQILQVGVVEFDEEFNEIGCYAFYPPIEKDIQQDTLFWQLDNHPQLLVDLYTHQPKSKVILPQGKGIRYWAKPTQFDITFLIAQGYLTFGKFTPVDVRSYCLGRGKEYSNNIKVELPEEGQPHDGIYDALVCVRRLNKLFSE